MGVLDRFLGGTNLEVFKVRLFLPPAARRLRTSSSRLSCQPWVRELMFVFVIAHQFGMYIMFPIGWMYYFGTNLDQRFSVPDFWPKAGETHRIPFEREELGVELERLRTRRLAIRDARLQREAGEQQLQHQQQEARATQVEAGAAFAERR